MELVERVEVGEVVGEVEVQGRRVVVVMVEKVVERVVVVVGKDPSSCDPGITITNTRYPRTKGTKKINWSFACIHIFMKFYFIFIM